MSIGTNAAIHPRSGALVYKKRQPAHAAMPMLEGRHRMPTLSYLRRRESQQMPWRTDAVENREPRPEQQAHDLPGEGGPRSRRADTLFGTLWDGS